MIRFLQSEHPARKIIFVVIIGVSCVAMVLFLIPGFMSDTSTTGANGILVKVGDEVVTTDQVRSEGERYAQQQRVPPQFMGIVYQNLSQELVQRSALLYEAHRLGLRVTDQEVTDELREGPYKAQFFPDGKYIGEEKFKALLAENNLTVEQFERNVRDGLLLRKLEALLTQGVNVTDEEAYQEYAQETVNIKFQYALLSAEALAKSANPTEPELKKFFEDNKARFQAAVPEKREIKYVVIDRSKVENSVKVTDDDLRRYYNDHKEEYKVQDEVNVRLIRVSAVTDAQGKVSPEADAAAKQKADAASKQLKAGVDFGKVAKQYSDDPSKEQGGVVGWLQRGRAPEIENQLFAMNKGQTSDVIKVNGGYVIVRVDDKHSGHIPTFDEVKAQIAPAVLGLKMTQALETLERNVEAQARQTNLDAAATKNGLTAMDSGLVTRQDALPGVGNVPALMEAAFSAGVNNPPESVSLPTGFAIFQVTKVAPPTPPTFEQVRPIVVQQFKAMMAERLLQAKLQQLADRAHSEHDLSKAAKEVGATLKTSDFVTPASQVPDIGSMQAAPQAFDLQPGQISDPIMLQGSGVVLQVTDRKEPPRTDFDSKKDQVRDAVIQRKRGQVLQLYLANLMKELEKNGKIKWNAQERDALLKTRTGI